VARRCCSSSPLSACIDKDSTPGKVEGTSPAETAEVEQMNDLTREAAPLAKTTQGP